MKGQDNILQFSGSTVRRGGSLLDSKGQQVVSNCRNVLVATSRKLMAGLFEHLDDSLYELADKSNSNTLQTSFFDAMRVLRKERVTVEREFFGWLLQVFDDYWETGNVDIAKRTLDQLSQDSEMALLDNDELEDSLAITNMVSKSENRYSKELNALSQRFSFLIEGHSVLPSKGGVCPLDPAVICNAFQLAMQGVSVELPVKLIVYKQFEKHFLQYLGGLYDEINQVLVKAGIITNLPSGARRTPIVPSGQQRRQAREGNTPFSDSRDSDRVGEHHRSHRIASVQDEVFSTLQQFLDLRRSASIDSLKDTSILMSELPNAGLQAVDTRELLSALSTLQQSNILILPQMDGDHQHNPRILKQQLTDGLLKREGEDPNRTLDDADNDTIDLITMLFDFIMDDMSLPDAMKALLSRLQIPMLKVAIIDKSFFSNNSHPARQLLNSLAQAAVGWNEMGDRDSDILYKKIESIIKHIMSDFYDDAEVFADLNEEFSAWWMQEQHGAEVAEQRTNQVTRGKEQLRGAKQIVVQELNHRLENLEMVPEVVMELLEDGWKDVLLLNYLRQGPDSDEWKDSLAIVDRLLWSVQPKTEYAERQELLRNIPALLRNLREKLNSISFDQHQMARLFKELQGCHISCLRGGEAAITKGSGTYPARIKKISFPDSQIMTGTSSLLVEENPDMAKPARDDFTIQAENLEVGEWLEIFDGTSKSRVKLSWKSNVSNLYIFVNRKGMKSMEVTLEGLAGRLRNQTARLVEIPQAPIMDRALEAMLSALKKTDHASSPT